MRLTKHAAQRMARRGINRDQIASALAHGEIRPARCGRRKFIVTRWVARRFGLSDDTVGVAAIVYGRAQIVTVYRDRAAVNS